MEWIRRLMMRETTTETQQQGANRPARRVRYDKPRIMLIDLSDEVDARLSRSGYNVVCGTFGHPYKVPARGDFVPVVSDHALLGYEEQEIVVVDLSPPEPLDAPAGESLVDKGKAELLTGSSAGIVDPRPVTMHFSRSHFDRILDHGGCFVVFGAPRTEQKFLLRIRGVYGLPGSSEERAHDSWTFLSTLSSEHVRVTAQFGVEIATIRYEDLICSTLRRYLAGSWYGCTLERNYGLSEHEWRALAVNKYDETVSVALMPDNSRGFVLVLPQIADKAGLLKELMEEVLPELAPGLFPHVEGRRWLERPEYELSTVVGLRAEKDRVTEQANERLAEIDRQIDKEREDSGFLHEILVASGDDLVTAVASSLEFIGFDKVINVDELQAEAGEELPRQEDLHILDASPALLIEVKGLAGLPREADSFQVVKYVNRRMKEWNSTDVQGLSIINHQRNLPGLDRKGAEAFTSQQVEDAEENEFGLLTTWELFLLLRGMMKHRWDSSHLRSLLYRTGRIGRIPAHYKPIGKVFQYWDNIGVVGIEVENAALRRGDRIGFVLPGGFEEQVAESIEVDRAPVEFAEPDQQVGVKTPFGHVLLRIGTLVCVVGEETSAAG